MVKHSVGCDMGPDKSGCLVKAFKNLCDLGRGLSYTLRPQITVSDLLFADTIPVSHSRLVGFQISLTGLCVCCVFPLAMPV